MSLITWLADHLLGARKRAAEIRREIAAHDLAAGDIQTDLTRWTGDHARKVEIEMRGTRTRLAASGHLYSGAMRNNLEHIMVQAQEAWRNAASEKVRAFVALACAEGDGHDRRREGGPSLALSNELQGAVASWRERPYPIPDTGEGPLRPRDLIGGDDEIAPLLTLGGLTWETARQRSQ